MDEQRYDAGSESIDADAVCVQCGSVNREGVFICKTCGNNLRDQRALRLEADKALGGVHDPLARRRRMRGLLAAFGFLLILATTVNVNRITTWLIEIQSAPLKKDVRFLWDDPRLEAMADELVNAQISSSVSEQIIESPGLWEGFEGYFVITYQNRRDAIAPAGLALLRAEKDKFALVALLNDGTEVWGYANQKGDTLSLQWEFGAAYHQEKTYAFSGMAEDLKDGSIACYGNSEASGETFSFKAYRVPK
jgi:hypothetical protein